MDEVPKRVKRAIRELVGAAYEIEVGRALAELRGEFTRWERGDMTLFDLVGRPASVPSRSPRSA